MTKQQRQPSLEDGLHNLYRASIIVSGFGARNAYDSIAWYTGTCRSSTEYDAAIKVLTLRRAQTIIQKMADEGGSVEAMIKYSKQLLRVA